MPAITASSMLGAGVRTVTPTTLNGTDSLTYNETKNPILTLQNTTGAPITATIVGSAATAVGVAGVGNVTVSGGFSTGAIAATTGFIAIPLTSIREYLRGTITITGGTGLIATLLEY